MTQPLQCSSCVHWRRVRKDANWGECQKFGNHQLVQQGHPAQLAYLHPIVPADVRLQTRDVFFCASHESVKPKQTLVEAVQQASRAYTEASKL
jgi:hypothetical protein